METLLLTGLAQLLANEGCGTYLPTGAYPVGQTGIVVGGYQPETLPRLISLDTYQIADDLGPTTDDTIGLQIITRWETSSGVRDLDELVFGRLHGRTMFQLPTGVLVSDCYRRSGASLGQDTSKRWSRSSNFYLTVSRPSPYRH